MVNFDADPSRIRPIYPVRVTFFFSVFTKIFWYNKILFFYFDKYYGILRKFTLLLFKLKPNNIDKKKNLTNHKINNNKNI